MLRIADLILIFCLGPVLLFHSVGVGLYDTVQKIPLAECSGTLVCLYCAEFQIYVMWSLLVCLWVGTLLHGDEHALDVEELLVFSAVFQLS